MGKLSNGRRVFFCWGGLGLIGLAFVTSAIGIEETPHSQADFVLKELQLQHADARSAELLANERLATFERLFEKGSVSPLELKRATANAEFAAETSENAEVLLSYLKTLPSAVTESLENTEMFMALPGLSLQVGLIGFGHLRVLNKEATVHETEKLIRLNLSNSSSLDVVSTLRDSQSRDNAKLADIYSTESEKRMVAATLDSLNRKVKDVSERTTGSALLSDTSISLDDMLSDQNCENGAGYLATLYSWSATDDAAELAATRDLCRIFAESSAEVDFATAVVALAEISVEAKKTLLSRGSGSPLEFRIAEAKLGIAKSYLEQAKQNQALWKAKESLVMSLTDAPLTAPVSQVLPSNMAEAIAVFEDLSKNVGFSESKRLAQSGYSILMSQFESIASRARSEEVRKLSEWRLEALAKSKASGLELKRARLTLAKNRAYEQYHETIYSGLSAKLTQLCAIGRTMKMARSQGKSRDTFALPYSEMLASSLANFHELKSVATAKKNKERQILEFYDWKLSQLLSLHNDDQENLEVHRVSQMLEESHLMMRQIDETELLNRHRAKIAANMFDALIGNQAPLSAGDLAADVRDSLFSYHAVQLQQESGDQLARLNLQMRKEKLDRVRKVRSKGMASVRELNRAELKAKLASIKVANMDRRKDEITGLSHQMAAAFGVADASLTSNITEE